MRETERLLLNGCAPGQHAFIGIPTRRPVLRVCTSCQRMEDADGSTCLVCDRRGATSALMVRVDGLRASGLLCASCADAFAAEGELAGWQVTICGDATRTA
ncbi:MAG: hypothetical protein IT304_00330 [Dehalococcoidia bacterium]|nr:hypothetical protein [Dehalococcoidia bacterium]